MSHVALAALVLFSASALAQSPTEVPPAPPPTGAERQETEADVPAPAAPEAAAQDASAREAEVKRVVEDELADAKEELRRDLKAELEAQKATVEFDQEWRTRKTRLELLSLDGYYRVRPMFFHNLDLDRGADPSGYGLARTPFMNNENSQAWADMRLRLEPTLNVSEEVAIRMQLDVFDNLVFGSTPESGFTAAHRYQYDIFNETQISPRAGLNGFKDSVAFKRAYGEVSTPLGIFRFGRMGAHWGLGMQWNDGNCLDCDYGDTVDRLMFVTEIFDGIYVAPMLDFNVEGLLASSRTGLGADTDLSNLDDSHSYNLAIAKRDTPQQARAKLDNGQAVFNYGLLFSYRYQSYASTEAYGQTPIHPDLGDDFHPRPTGRVHRQGNLYMPNIWAKYERKRFRVEFEAASVIGKLGNRALNAADEGDATQNQALDVLQFGAVLQTELRFLEQEKFRLGLEIGFASGDRAPGFGARPGRPVPSSRVDGNTEPGDIDGPQFACQTTGGCADASINNFVYDRDYHVDMLFWRQMIGSVTDTIYVRPSGTFEVTPGLEIFASALYSRAVFAESAPGWRADGTPGSPDLGIELSAGAQFQTDDGFIANIRYGALFPLAGLRNDQLGLDSPSIAHGIRGTFGIRF